MGKVSTLRCKNCGKVFKNLPSELETIPKEEAEKLGLFNHFSTHQCDNETYGLVELIATHEGGAK